MVLKTRIVLFPAPQLGFLPRIKKPLRRYSEIAVSFLLILIVTGSLISCESSVVLGISRKEALENLKIKNINFILEADLEKMGELNKLGSTAPFYLGLLVKEAEDFPRAEALFAEALKSSSAQVRRASAAQLLPSLTAKNGDARSSMLHRIEKLSTSREFKGDSAIQTLRNAVLYRLGRYREIETLPAGDDLSSWNEGFSLLANLHFGENLDEEQKQKMQDYFLKGTIDEARIWAFQELQSLAPSWISSAEMSAIEGRIAVSKSNFDQGIIHFNTVIEEQQALFFVYIDLLYDLGRTYQFTKYQLEGIERFSEWESWLRTGAEMGTSLLNIDIAENRYRLLYFIGRIEQQRQNYTKSIQAFSEAVNLTTDKNQQDACIWYILNAVLLENPSEIISYLKKYTLQSNPINWNDDVYFSDIMDRVSQYLTSSGDWAGLLEVFNLVQNGNDHATIAKYAYIIARAVMEGFLPLEDASETAESFFRIAFEESGQAFYYKALSASFLDEEIELFAKESILEKQTTQRSSSNQDNENFLLGFFEFSAEQFAYSYFRNLSLTIAEQRIAAEHFIQSGNWYDAIRVSSAFMNQENYEITRADLEMFYPNPYTELIEKHATEQHIPVEVFFGLIRTESAFDKDIRSWAGAVGLSQLMRETALDMAGRIARAGGPNYIVNGEIDLLNPEINIHIGAFYLNYLINYMKSPALAIVAYNGGMGRVRRWRTANPNLPEDLFLETIPYTETRDYGRRVLGAAAAYGYLYYGLSMEAVIADIFR